MAQVFEKCVQRNAWSPLLSQKLSATYRLKAGTTLNISHRNSTNTCKWALCTKSARAAYSNQTSCYGASVSNKVRNVCMAKLRDGEQEEKAEVRIERLVAANKKLLTRLAELESIISQLKPETWIGSTKEVDDGESNANLVENSGDTLECMEESIHEEKTRANVCNIQWPSPDDEVPFWKRPQKVDNDIETTNKEARGRKDTHQDSDSVYVIHLAAEMAPIAKVGGLGDVVTGLGRACFERGHKVLVMLPFYECIDTQQVEDLSEGEPFKSYHRGSWTTVRKFEGKVTGIPVLLLQPSNQFFKGRSIYGGAYDELEAYLFFCRAALESLQTSGDHPDIIHIHEWHMGAVAMLYWDMYHYLSLKKPRIVLTIHNMEHYGECRVEQINMCGLDGSVYRTIDRAVDDRTIGHNPERLSLLKGGIVYSNAVTTVSPTYASETLCSGWMANTLLKHRSKYVGILNGIDTASWNPANDPYIPMDYSVEALYGKQVCKQYVQRGLGLDPDDFPGDVNSSSEGKRSPLAICITRLVAQKGIHLIRHAINTIGELGGQFILLGTAPDPRLQAEFESLARQLTKSKNVRLLLFYSEEMAHMLYAAADIVLVPSMFEPCGLTQMIGLRYGAIPLVRRTGGLADTVFDVDDQARASIGNGFVFDGISEDSFSDALRRAVRYYQRREWWQDLTARAMQVDYSWNKSAQEYLALYKSLRVRV